MAKIINHIRRAPLPWQLSKITECGLLADRRDAVVDYIPESTSNLTRPDGICATCWERMRFGTGETSLEREMSWARRSRPSLGRQYRFLECELQVIGELVREHQAEFDQRVAALQAEEIIKGGR